MERNELILWNMSAEEYSVYCMRYHVEGYVTVSYEEYILRMRAAAAIAERRAVKVTFHAATVAEVEEELANAGESWTPNNCATAVARLASRRSEE